MGNSWIPGDDTGCCPRHQYAGATARDPGWPLSNPGRPQTGDQENVGNIYIHVGLYILVVKYYRFLNKDVLLDI